ncbi:MAG: alanine racemase [Candidatus Fermentibacteraceae bacterium]
MNRIVVNADALVHNYRTVHDWVSRHNASLTVVTKALCGFSAAVESLVASGVSSVADSRISNLVALEPLCNGMEKWFLRAPASAEQTEVVRHAHVSLNTELSTVKELNRVAEKQGVVHKVILMIELGDLREGILPGSLVGTYRDVFNLEHIEVLGIGSNLGCLSGTVPNSDQTMQLVLYRELLELKFDRRIPLISAGASATLPFLLQGRVPKQLNHFRVGESILLGTDLMNGGTMPGLREDGFTLEAEVIEVKEKNLTPFGETSDDLHPFQTAVDCSSHTPGERGYRAVVTVGELDTEVSSLSPVNPEFRIAGASSDVTVLNLGSRSPSVRVGDTVRFRTGYAGLVRLMNNPYTEKTLCHDADDCKDTPESRDGAVVNH